MTRFELVLKRVLGFDETATILVEWHSIHQPGFTLKPG
jgi:hypothetical protein